MTVRIKGCVGPRVYKPAYQHKAIGEKVWAAGPRHDLEEELRHQWEHSDAGVQIKGCVGQREFRPAYTHAALTKKIGGHEAGSHCAKERAEAKRIRKKRLPIKACVGPREFKPAYRHVPLVEKVTGKNEDRAYEREVDVPVVIKPSIGERAGITPGYAHPRVARKVTQDKFEEIARTATAHASKNERLEMRAFLNNCHASPVGAGCYFKTTNNKDAKSLASE